MRTTLMNTTTGITMGTVDSGIVTDAHGNRYKVSDGDIKWLQGKANKGTLVTSDIKAVGALMNITNKKINRTITKLHQAYKQAWKLRILAKETDMPAILDQLSDMELSLVCSTLKIETTRDIDSISNAICNKYHA